MTDAYENRGAEREAREVQQDSCNAKWFYIVPAGVLCFSILRNSVDGYLGIGGMSGLLRHE